MEFATSIAAPLRWNRSAAGGRFALEREYRNRFMMTPDEDMEMVRRIAGGDGGALRALYDAYGARLYSYALRLTGSPAAAEDVLQECLLAIWQSARRYRGEGRLLAWLLGIVHHKAIDSLRGRVISSMDAEDREIPSGEPLPEESAILSERSDLLRAGLERLPLKQRMTLELVFFQGLSLRETAKVCGCPVGTVKSRLNHAKSGLRRMWEGGPPDGEGSR